MTARIRMAIAQILGCTIEEASNIDPLEELELTDGQRAYLAEAAAAEYRHAAASILDPYGFTLSGDGEVIRSEDVAEDSAYPWDEDAVLDELNAINLPWAFAFARAVSAHNCFVEIQSSCVGARAIRDEAIVQAVQAGVGARRLAASMGIAESTVEAIIAGTLGR